MATFTPSYQVDVDLGTGWQTLPAGAVIAVSGLVALSGNRVTPLLAGDTSSSEISITIKMSALSAAPRDMPIRVTYTMDGNQARAFVGTRQRAARSRSKRQWNLSCVGIQKTISKTRIESRNFIGRPVATKTTIATVEDPTNNSYQAGPINYALWKAGGRPYEQSFTYPNAKFYYSLDRAMIGPPRSWFHGEDTWNECLKLVRASGGQLYQDQAGIVRYRQPLGFGDGVTTHTFSDTGSPSSTQTIYKDLEEDDSGEAVPTRIVCPYVSRVTLPIQTVAEQTQPRLIPGLKTITIPIDTQHPLDSLEMATATTLKPEAILMIDGAGFVAPSSAWSHSVTWDAQRVVVTIQNLVTAPLTLERLTLRGEPNGPGEASSVAVGSSDETNTLTIEESAYIQQESDAEALASLYLAMQTGARAVRVLRGCPYDPRRTVGETVDVACTAFGMSATRHVIIAIDHKETGKLSDYTVVDVSALPKASDYYEVGTTDYSGQTKMLAW